MKYTALVAILFSSFMCNPADATHKAWLLKHSGASCKLWIPTVAQVTFPGIVRSENRVNALVTCPISLAAIGGSSSGLAVDGPKWLHAKQARIYFRKGRGIYWCRARAEDTDGNAYYSARRGGDEPGFVSIDLIDNERTWAGFDSRSVWTDLGAIEPVAQVEFECVTGSAAVGAPAELVGYDLAICQSQPGCNTVRVDSINRVRIPYVQGSGIECVPGTENGAESFVRNEWGFHNRGRRTETAYCPITPPADDSYEHRRQIYTTHLTYRYNKPSCVIVSINNRGEEILSRELEEDFPGELLLLGRHDVGVDKSLFFKCEVPPTGTIVGYTARMSTTRQSGGI